MEMVYLLRSLGYNVLTSYEAGQANQKIPDEQVLIYATNAARIVITENIAIFSQINRA